MIIGFGSKEHLIQLRNEGERERRKENKNKKDVGKKNYYCALLHFSVNGNISEWQREKRMIAQTES